MAKNDENHTLYRKEDGLYDEDYYKYYDQQGYSRSSEWLDFFGLIADYIVERLSPKTALDAGCAYGLLVESLRDRGVEAYGIDVSSYAISRARHDIQPYITQASLLEPIDYRVDLLISIEVVEHIKEEDCDLAIRNMCAISNAVLVSTTPDDFEDPTHFNVNPPSYWVRKFSEFGFDPDINFDAGFLTPYAILFKKRETFKKSAVHTLYGEKKLLDYKFSRINHELNLANQTEQRLLKNVDELEDKIGIAEKVKIDDTRISII